MTERLDIARQIIEETCPHRRLKLENIQMFSEVIQCRKFHKGEVILAEGEVCTCLSYIEKGLAETNVELAYLYRRFMEDSLMLSQVKADILRFESAKDRYTKLMQLFCRRPCGHSRYHPVIISVSFRQRRHCPHVLPERDIHDAQAHM